MALIICVVAPVDHKNEFPELPASKVATWPEHTAALAGFIVKGLPTVTLQLDYAEQPFIFVTETE